MKRLLSIGVLFCVLAVLVGCGSGGGGGTTPPPPPANTPTPAATAVGAPAGDPVSATIGAAGGSLSTADGKIVLTVPAGALAADTVIGIQPLTNMAHGRIGAAYRLTPDGQQFQTPVMITFPYTDQDLQGTAAEALAAAFQTADGFWQWAGEATVDTAAKTVSVQSSHFSDWSLVVGVQIRPPSKTVRVNETAALQVDVCYPVMIDEELPSLAYQCDDEGPDALPILNRVSEWSVNGVLGGTGVTGTVSGSGATAAYTAPANKPNPSTVAVSARVQTRRGRVLVVSNITIVDNDSWVGTTTVVIKDLSGKNVSEVNATVNWKAVPMEAPRARYAAEGTIRVSFPGFENCSWAPSELPIQPEDGLLVVDYSVDPPTYEGSGMVVGDVTITCNFPEGQSQHDVRFHPWFDGSGSVTENGTVIAGSSEGFSYRFTRPQ